MDHKTYSINHSPAPKLGKNKQEKKFWNQKKKKKRKVCIVCGNLEQIPANFASLARCPHFVLYCKNLGMQQSNFNKKKNHDQQNAA